MRYQRLHIRVPASGDVVHSTGEEIIVEAIAINISAGGLCITAPSHLVDQTEYQVQVITPSNAKMQFSGFPVYQTIENIGIKITAIDKENLKSIYQIIGSFQLTDKFIKYVGERDIIDDWLVDESGEDIEVTFEADPERNK